jgi:hypothetical protein
LRAFLEGKIMKKYLTSAVLIVIVTAAAAIAAPQTYTAPIKPKRAVKKAPPPLHKEEVRGVLPRAFAPGNNPLQMLNPKAPAARYGTSQQHVAYDPYTGKPMGIKLFEIIF